MKKIDLDFGGMTGKQVEAMAAGTLQQGGFIPPADAPPLGKFWTKVGTNLVRRETVYRDTGQKLTEIFDFATRTCQYTCDDQKTGQSNMMLKSLDEIEPALVEEAHSALRKLSAGAKLPPPP